MNPLVSFTEYMRLSIYFLVKLNICAFHDFLLNPVHPSIHLKQTCEC